MNFWGIAVIVAMALSVQVTTSAALPTPLTEIDYPKDAVNVEAPEQENTLSDIADFGGLQSESQGSRSARSFWGYGYQPWTYRTYSYQPWGYQHWNYGYEPWGHYHYNHWW